MMTSTALVFLAIVAGCLAGMTPEEEAEKCMGEVGVADKEELDNDEGKRKCFYKCILEINEVMDADGTPLSDNVEKFADEKISDEDKREEVIETFKECADKTHESHETDPCEKASIMFGCLMENSKEIRELVHQAKGD